MFRSNTQAPVNSGGERPTSAPTPSDVAIRQQSTRGCRNAPAMPTEGGTGEGSRAARHVGRLDGPSHPAGHPSAVSPEEFSRLRPPEHQAKVRARRSIETPVVGRPGRSSSRPNGDGRGQSTTQSAPATSTAFIDTVVPLRLRAINCCRSGFPASSPPCHSSTRFFCNV